MGSVYLDHLPGALEPKRTPFDDAGVPPAPVHFIYMTNRYEGRWSYLMPPGFEKTHDPSHYISVGYTQLWIMEKLFVVHPIRRVDAKPALPSFEPGIARDDYERVFHVLREPQADVRDHNDYLGARVRYDDAVTFARDVAAGYGWPTLVARLVGDWYWH